MYCNCMFISSLKLTQVRVDDEFEFAIDREHHGRTFVDLPFNSITTLPVRTILIARTGDITAADLDLNNTGLNLLGALTLLERSCGCG